MDSHLIYKYKDGLHDDVKDGYLTFERGVFKHFTGTYDTKHDDNVSKLERRLWNCHLMATTDHRCKAFLKDISDFWKTLNIEYDEDFDKAYKWLSRPEIEIVSIEFTMY